MKRWHYNRLRGLHELLLNFDKYKREAGVEHFDMRHWHCGTAACAAGTAALHPKFKKAGLRLPGGGWVTPYYKGLYSYEALAAFFGISTFEALSVFSSTSYPERNDLITPGVVARRVERLLKRYKGRVE